MIFLPVPFLFITFAFVLLWMAGIEMLAMKWKSMAWPIIIRKTFALRFLLFNWNVGNFKGCSDEDSGGRLPIVYIYTMA